MLCIQHSDKQIANTMYMVKIGKLELLVENTLAVSNFKFTFIYFLFKFYTRIEYNVLK